MSKAVGIIPARLAATRLPNKPLLDIGGKTMIQRVYEQARLAQRLEDLYVATPDSEIFEVVTGFGGKAILTRPDHPSGTDRLAEAAATLSEDIQVIVNIQGDEPLIDPATIDAVADALLAHSSDSLSTSRVVMASLCCPLSDERAQDPNTVKVVCDQQGIALYFSRHPIPYRRNPEIPQSILLHVGLYAYYRHFLLEFPRLPRTPLEQIESLEQLRAVEHGYAIRMVRTSRAPESVDTPEDLERVRALIG